MRPRLEALEDRFAPSVYQVTGVLDTSGLTPSAGAGTPADPFLIGSLRSAIEQVNAHGPTDTILFNSSLSGQTITLGGSALPVLTTTAGTVTITGPGGGITIDANHQPNILVIDSGVTATLAGITFTNATNSAIRNSGMLAVAGCTLSENSGGGAIYNAGGTLTVTNSTLAGNTAVGGAGGIYNQRGMIITVNSTLVLNQATTGVGTQNAGGIYNDNGTLTLYNTLVAGNTLVVAGSNQPSDIAGSLAEITGGYSLIGDPNSAGGLSAAENNILGDGHGNLLPIGNIVVGTVPADNGGPTATFALVANSPAIDAGAIAQAIDAHGKPLQTDQRGAPFVRIYGGSVDIGAYEAQPVFVINTTSDALNPGAGLLSLRQAITDANASPGADSITFAAALVGQTITLGGTALPDLSDKVTITGPGGGITIDANHLSRIVTIDSGVTAALSGMTFTNGNASGAGGAINDNGNLTLTNCTISGNSATGFGGGIQNTGTLTLTNCTLAGNTAGSGGGGIYNPSGTLTLSGCTLSGNSAAGPGGGIDNGGTLTLTNSTLSGSSAATAGGIANGGTATVVNCTIVLNQAVPGGGPTNAGGIMNNNATMTLNNTLVAGNSVVAGSGNYNDIAGTVSGSYNLIGDPNSAGSLGAANHNILGNGHGNALPIGAIVVGAVPANNGGPTATFALAATSPAIDAGSNALAVDAQGNPLQTDQRGAGFPRIIHFTVDIGAVESTSPLQPFINLANAHHFYIDSMGLYENSYGGQEKWLRGDVNSFGNFWYYVLPTGDVFAWAGGTTLTGTKLLNAGVNAWENPELLVNAASLTAANPNQIRSADQARAFFRSSFGNFYLNAYGGNEKWLEGMIAAKAPANQNNPWYFIKPDGSVWEWDGTVGKLSGTQVSTITPDVNLYAEPALLYDAYQNTAVNSGGEVNNYLSFYFDRSGPARNLWENWSQKADEKWFRGALVNQFHNNWFFILPNGDLYAWDAKSPASGQLLTNPGADAWNDIERVVGDRNTRFGLSGDQPQQMITLDTQYHFFRASLDTNYYFSYLGQNEKWLRGGPNSFGNDWYFILPSGALEAWDGRSGGSVLISNLPFPVLLDPLVLASAFADGAVLGTQVNLDPFAPNSGGPGDRLG